MCKAVEELKQDFFDEGKENGKRQLILTMINNGVSDDFIIKNCNVTLKDLEQYKNEVQ